MRRIAVDDRAGQAPQPGQQRRVSFGLLISVIVGLPAGGLAPGGATHQHAVNGIAVEFDAVAAVQPTAGVFGIEPPRETRRLNERSGDDTRVETTTRQNVADGSTTGIVRSTQQKKHRRVPSRVPRNVARKAP